MDRFAYFKKSLNRSSNCRSAVSHQPDTSNRRGLTGQLDHLGEEGPGYQLLASEVKVAQSCPTLCNRGVAWLHGLYSPWNSLGQNTGVGSLSLLQGIFPTPGIERGSRTLQVDSLPAEPQSHGPNFTHKVGKKLWKPDKREFLHCVASPIPGGKN